eukprot:TRINITY_DN19176_c0_g1_i1.p1 TRINITY_DN19176_c0_g1~~TRINITY_DN19176_c0_g1_i1.p1  ORF type:complete len:668 (-),score=155.71 TRINITY_DN19176_c0_g1_i1:34-2001(-)
MAHLCNLYLKPIDEIKFVNTKVDGTENGGGSLGDADAGGRRLDLMDRLDDIFHKMIPLMEGELKLWLVENFKKAEIPQKHWRKKLHNFVEERKNDSLLKALLTNICKNFPKEVAYILKDPYLFRKFFGYGEVQVGNAKKSKKKRKMNLNLKEENFYREEPERVYERHSSEEESYEEEQLKPDEEAFLKRQSAHVPKYLPSTYTNRIAKWFSGFNYSAKFERGAPAIEQFSFLNRDKIWSSQLEWQTSRQVTPIAAAAQRHLWLHLDVEKTITNFLDIDEFWFSNCFMDTVKSGEFLQIDYDFFVNELCKYFEKSKKGTQLYSDINNLVYDYIEKSSLQDVANILITLSNEDLYLFLGTNITDVRKLPDSVEQAILFLNWPNVKQLLIMNALSGPHRLDFVKTAFETAELRNDILRSIIKNKFILKSEEDRNNDELSHWVARKLIISCCRTLKPDSKSSRVSQPYSFSSLISRSSSYTHQDRLLFPIRYMLMESFLIQFRLSCCTLQRETIETLLDREGLPWEAIVEKEILDIETPQENLTKEAPGVGGWKVARKRKREKKRERIEEFIGWRIGGTKIDRENQTTDPPGSPEGQGQEEIPDLEVEPPEPKKKRRKEKRKKATKLIGGEVCGLTDISTFLVNLFITKSYQHIKQNMS